MKLFELAGGEEKPATRGRRIEGQALDDYVVGVSIRPHGTEHVVVHNICAIGLVIGGKTVHPTQKGIVKIGDDFRIGPGTFRARR
jgi:hypothetical protein